MEREHPAPDTKAVGQHIRPDISDKEWPRAFGTLQTPDSKHAIPQHLRSVPKATVPDNF